MSFNKNNMDKYEYIIHDENFPGEGMTQEERDYCLNILENCKDICDSDNKVNGIGKCRLVRLRLKKEDNIVNVDGGLYIGNPNTGEARYINADIFFNPNSIIVDMKITRLGVECENKVYTVLDKFTLKNGNLNRRSLYNYDMKFMNNFVENEEMKGRLK